MKILTSSQGFFFSYVFFNFTAKQIQPTIKSFNPILEEDSNADLEEACATVKISR